MKKSISIQKIEERQRFNNTFKIEYLVNKLTGVKIGEDNYFKCPICKSDNDKSAKLDKWSNTYDCVYCNENNKEKILKEKIEKIDTEINLKIDEITKSNTDGVTEDIIKKEKNKIICDNIANDEEANQIIVYSPARFVSAYIQSNNWNEVATYINEKLNYDMPLFDIEEERREAEENNDRKFNFYSVNPDIVLNYDNKISERLSEFVDIIDNNDFIIAQAPTGSGKTFTILKVGNEFNMDFTLLNEPIRALAKQVQEDYPDHNIKVYYGTDKGDLPKGIVSTTYSKTPLISTKLDDEEFRCRLNGKDMNLMYIVDECHQLLSTRSMRKNDIDLMETVMKKADKVILMSSTPEFTMEAYKDFNPVYVKFQPNKANNNIDNHFITRCEEKQFKAVLMHTIKKELDNHEFILYSENNIENLEIYQKMLKKNFNIDSIVINSQNKEEEEVKGTLNEIIKHGKLKSKVILCTSVINVGVNIYETNVCTMIKNRRFEFDNQMIEQFSARPRIQGGNTHYTFLTKKSGKHKETEITSFEKEVNLMYNKVKILADDMKENVKCYISKLKHNQMGTFLNQLSPEEKVSVIKHIKYLCSMKKYKGMENYISFDEEEIIVIDEKMIIENARLNFIRSGYYNDDFMLQALSSVKAENTEIIDIELTKEEESNIEVVEKEQKDFTSAFGELISNEENKEEFIRYITDSTVKFNDIVIFEVQSFIEEFKNHRRYKELRSAIKNILLFTSKRIEYSATKETQINQTINLFATIKDKKTLELCVNVMKYVYQLNLEYNNILTNNKGVSSCGDDIYSNMRIILDVVCNSRSKATNKKYNLLYTTIYGKSKKFENEKFKSEKIKELKLISKYIYFISDKGNFSNKLQKTFNLEQFIEEYYVTFIKPVEEEKELKRKLKEEAKKNKSSKKKSA